MRVISWPNEHKFAASLTFDFDAESVWLGEDPNNAEKPGVLSQGIYGVNVGTPLILGLLRSHGVKATFFVPGIDAESHPQTVHDIVADGHELAHHGYTHRNPTELTEAEQEHELRQGLKALEPFNTELVGYRSPSWELTDYTRRRLVELGFEYSSNQHDDIMPYRTDDGLVEVPVSWVLDDAAHFWFANDTWEKTIRSPGEVLDIWLPEIDAIADLGGHIMLTMHPMLIGRPSRVRMLDQVIRHLKNQGAWIATAAEVARFTK